MQKLNFFLIENYKINSYTSVTTSNIKGYLPLLNVECKEKNFTRSVPLVSFNLSSQTYLKKSNFKTVFGILGETAAQLKKNDPEIFLAQLRLVGIGYRVFQFDDKLGKSYLIFDLGSSKLTVVYIPREVSVKAEKSSILVYGNSLHKVRSFWSRLANLKRPDVYKGKGIQKLGVVYRLKEGKKK